MWRTILLTRRPTRDRRRYSLASGGPSPCPRAGRCRCVGESADARGGRRLKSGVGRADSGRRLRHHGTGSRGSTAHHRRRWRRMRASCTVAGRRAVGAAERRRHRQGAMAGIPGRRPSAAVRPGPRRWRPSWPTPRATTTPSAGRPAQGRGLLTRAAAKHGWTLATSPGTASFFQGVRVARPTARCTSNGACRCGRVRRIPRPPARRGRCMANAAHPLAGPPHVMRHRPRRAGLAGPNGCATVPSTPSPNTTAPCAKHRKCLGRSTERSETSVTTKVSPRPASFSTRSSPRARHGRRWCRPASSRRSSTCTATRPSTACSTAADDHAERYSAQATIAAAGQHLPDDGSRPARGGRARADDDRRRRGAAITTPSRAPARRSRTRCATATTPCTSTRAWRTSSPRPPSGDWASATSCRTSTGS